MIIKLNKKRVIWKALIVLFLAFTIGHISISSPFALANSMTVDSSIRADMLSIANLYVNHRWNATETNLLHYPYPPERFYGYPDPLGQLLESNGIDIKYFIMSQAQY